MMLERNDTRNSQIIDDVKSNPARVMCAHPDNHVHVVDSNPVKQSDSMSLTFVGDQMQSDVVEIVLTDDEIGDMVREALHASAFRQLRSLQAYCDNGRVTLQGRLPTFYLKQVAQTAICSVPGIREIDNDIRVSSAW